MPGGSDRIQTRSGVKRQAASSSQKPANESELSDQPTPSKRPLRSTRQSESAPFSPEKSLTPPTLQRETMVVVDLPTIPVSPPFDENEIKEELEAKKVQLSASRRNQRVFTKPIVYYEMREYVLRGKGSLDGLVNMIREQGGDVTKRALEEHFGKNIEFYNDGYVEADEVLERIKREKNNEPTSIMIVKREPTPEPKTADDEEVERRIMRLLENPELIEPDPQEEDEETAMYNPDLEQNDEMKGAIIMTNDEIEFYQSLSQEAYQVLDDFNSRRIQKYENFCEEFKNHVHVEEELNDVLLLQILHYRRFEHPPPIPENARELTADEAVDFLNQLDENFCYFLDLYTHQHIYGVETVGLLIEAHTGEILTEKSVRRILYARRRAHPPQPAPASDYTVTTGYLSHDYWPSLLCVPEGDHHIRFFNLTNVRSDGNLRYYRCSKCCTIKVSASRNIKNRRYSKEKIDMDFQVPKLQIRGNDVVTNWTELSHYEDCHPTPIPNMLAEQLDRRARRQASLGLLAPREAWTEAYFSALRISEYVAQIHPGTQTVAEIFPDYNDTRGQYSRSFHKYKRTISMLPEDKPVVEKKKLVPNNDMLDRYNEIDDVGRPAILTRSRGGLRRGREADALLEMHVPAGYKRVMAPGYVAVDDLEPMEYYYDEQEADVEQYYEEDAPLNVDQIEQEEVVVTDGDRAEEQQSTDKTKSDEPVLVVS
ncbi:hypothetical protein M3Y98_00187700 [Aphelenchoides besseyi]|nr:hypothetical protein M3Y98_00187700 [Aphelenchoides besseyi]KAI6200180.1 hypothetical protein M3Y96_00705600 [Aphelenchoides besseyi]